MIWPYGAALDASGNSLCPNSPAYFFCPDGSYEIYDYRSPGELRIDAMGEALLQGHFKTGKVAHDLVAGGTLFHRTVDLSPTIVYYGAGCREYLSAEYCSMRPRVRYQHAGPATLADFNRQARLLCRTARICRAAWCCRQAGASSCERLQLRRPAQIWLPQYAVTYTPQ